MKKITDKKSSGLKLLLSFALGPLEAGNCGSQSFFIQVKDYLNGNSKLHVAIVSQIPDELTSAWPNLVAIAARMKSWPLSHDVVSQYVYKEHNCNVMKSCTVKKGKVISIDKNSLKAKINGESAMQEINFLPVFAENIKKGDSVFYHYNWLISKA
jgi:hypothetical protein